VREAALAHEFNLKPSESGEDGQPVVDSLQSRLGVDTLLLKTDHFAAVFDSNPPQEVRVSDVVNLRYNGGAHLVAVQSQQSLKQGVESSSLSWPSKV